MFKKLFGKKRTTLLACCNGRLVNLEDINDEVFSKKLMGDGYAIMPSDGNIYSPVNASVTTIFPTMHAIGLISENGEEILIHLGIDSVTMEGNPFDLKIAPNTDVYAGDFIGTMDIKAMEENNINPTVLVIVTNLAQDSKFLVEERTTVTTKMKIVEI